MTDLFVREWLAGHHCAAQGDGLGPMFNDTSCVGCHNLGGIGGAGPESKNIDMLSVVALADRTHQAQHKPKVGDQSPVLWPHKSNGPRDRASRPNSKKQLAALHPGFADSRSIVLHRFSVDADYGEFRTPFRIRCLCWA